MQNYQYGAFAPDRTLIYLQSPLNNETVISLSGSNRIFGVYLTDTLSPSSLLHVTLAARYNRNTESTRRLQRRHRRRRCGGRL